MGLKIKDITLGITGGYIISPPCYVIPHNCYITGCYTVMFEAKNITRGVILTLIGKLARITGCYTKLILTGNQAGYVLRLKDEFTRRLNNYGRH